MNEKLGAGSYEVDWDGTGYLSGTYFYRIAIYSDRLTAGDYTDTKKVILMK